jgi:hypothetical protein
VDPAGDQEDIAGIFCAERGAIWRKRRKLCFIKYNVSRNNNMAIVQIEAMIALMLTGVTKKHTA